MNLIGPVNMSQLSGDVKTILDNIEQKMDSVPNFFATLANSPIALQAYTEYSEILSNGVLGAGTREKIAVAVASHNQCEYCLAAHTAIGESIGLSREELISAQAALSMDAKEQAILEIALQLNANHGHPGGEIVQKAKNYNIGSEELFEIAANVALNVFSNSVNGLAYTDIDFPIVRNTQEAA